MKKKYQMCSRCVMDTTDPEAFFDKLGVCNHCIKFEARTKLHWFPNEDGIVRLKKYLTTLSMLIAAKSMTVFLV